MKYRNNLIELLNAEKAELESKIPKREPRPRQEGFTWDPPEVQKLRKTLDAFNTVLEHLNTTS